MTVTAERAEAKAPGLSFNCMPAMLRGVAQTKPADVALREKNYGIWDEVTYAGYWDMVKTAGMALWALGVRPGDKVAIHSENRIAWVVSDLAAQGIQAASVGLYATNPAPEVGYLLGHSGAKVLIAEDQEQVDKALEVRDNLLGLEKIVYLERRGTANYDDPILMSWEEFLEAGRAQVAESPELFDELVDGVDPDELATLVYTSGTTGPPKGAMLSHRNLVWTAERSGEVINGLVYVDDAQFLSYLPLCHVFARIYDSLAAISRQATVNFAESIETVVQDLGEIQPSYFPAPPRILEKMHAGVMIKMSDASRLKRAMFGIFLWAGYWNADRILQKGRRGLLGELVHRIGWLLVYRSLQGQLGLRNCKSLVSASAPIAPEVLKFFMAIGVPVYEAWGMTETTGYGTVNKPGDIKLGTIGTANPDVEMRLAEDGEILIRHAGIFQGYYANPEATGETIEPDGWMHTGDIAELDGDHYRIVDRKKDIIITAGGKNLSPSEIENKLKVSPFIKEAIVIGDRRRFVSALIGIELDTVSSWAVRRNLTFTTYRDLTDKEEVRALVRQEVDKANEAFAGVAQVKQFRLIPKELDHEQGELTATQKVKRSVIEGQFSELIEAMYS